MDGQYGFSNNNVGGQQQFNNMNGQMQNMNAPDYMLWLILGIIQICSLCCCNCAGLIFGILTTVFVITANKAFKMGDNITYQSKMKTAKIINLIGWGLMVVGWVIEIVSGIFNSVINNVKSI